MHSPVNREKCGCKWVKQAWIALKMRLEKNVAGVLRKRCEMLPEASITPAGEF